MLDAALPGQGGNVTGSWQCVVVLLVAIVSSVLLCMREENMEIDTWCIWIFV